MACFGMRRGRRRVVDELLVVGCCLSVVGCSAAWFGRKYGTVQLTTDNRQPTTDNRYEPTAGHHLVQGLRWIHGFSLLRHYCDRGSHRRDWSGRRRDVAHGIDGHLRTRRCAVW